MRQNRSVLSIIVGIASASMLGVWSSQAQFTTSNLLVNPGAETGDLTGWTVGSNSNPNVDNGSFDPGISPHSGNWDFYGGTAAFGSLSQTIQVSNVVGISFNEIDRSDVIANVGFWEQGLNQGTPSDDAAIALTFYDSSSNTIGSVSTPQVDSHNLTWSNYTKAFVVPAGTRSISYTMEFFRYAGNDNDSFVDDNVLTLTIAGPPPLMITSIKPSGNDVKLVWNGLPGSNVVQVSRGTSNGGYTNNFADLATIVLPGAMVTNYTDSGGATNRPSRFYRIDLRQ